MLTRNPKTKSSLQILQDSVKWHHMAHKVNSLLDAYSGLLSNESMILAVNSSFVDPLLQFESQLKIIESSFGMLVVMPSLDKVKEMGSSYEYIEDMENLYHNILNIYENILTSLVSKDLYKLQILKEMLVWMSKDSSYLQERIMVIINKVLRFTVTKVRKYISVDAPCLGLLAAELSLLCSHEDPSIVKQASLGMCHLLYIARCQNDIGTNKPTNGKSHSLQFPSSDVEFLPKEFQQDESKIAQRVGQTLLPPLLTDFVQSLLMKLSSPDDKIASDAASILIFTLEFHAEKVTMVSKIVDAIYRQLCDNNCMKDVMLQVITLLTCTSPKKVIFQLMDYPVPADDTLIQMWKAACSQASVAPHVLKTILLILKGKPGEMEDTVTEGKRFSLDITNLMPLAACQALCTFLPLGSYRKAVAQYFPQLLTTLMFQVFYNSELKPILKDRALYAQDALRVLLNCSGLQQVDITLMKENFWDQLSEDLCYYHGVCFIAKTLSEYNFPQFPETLSYLYKLSVEGPRRSEDTVIVLIFLTELLNNFFKDPLPEEFLVLFINWINDSNPVVSRLILHRIVHMSPIINKINGGIRSMAIRHFGQLVRDMRQYTWMVNDVVLEGLVPLILFLEDDDKRVAEACKYTLKICTSQLKWSTSRLLKDENYSFEMVVLNICNNLIISHRNYITDLTSDTLRFLWSPRTYLKRASVILIGYLAKSGGHLLLRDEIEVMLDVIERLLRDEDPMIKQLAEITYDIFKKKAHKLTSAPLKQNFQKLLKLFYIKKLKPLYNYNSPNGQIDSPTDSKDVKNDKAL
ncbi:maestro heat-like repeat-containing protein family member 9 isoform X2 [Homo sapiens]|uniref:maestro heat-like repeat-containing protein family member 9 isoform X2 n=1 Tax=Homo sapiens TaxID=9606 RepID=UPI0005D01FC4|nr:maestro heat-like repeat-containing protein family member 9 isoform X2 [Homo sapiens]XP_054194832.1 maestro heat-like repeat-containing protein family member 9 isoform X2 [Homo sapiens]|eukprot:XP_011508308.1 maestro heat-like repeat-containing protein family member 9 isoform X2 [Homo sapiens]